MPEIFHNNYMQIIVRCIAVYFFVIIAIRVFGKKELAQLSVIDLVFILLISNSVQNAMVGPDISLAGGIVAAMSLFVINYVLKQILYRNKNVNEFLQGRSVLLIYKGQLNADNLKKVEITIDELQAAVREHGISDIQHVDLAMLEVDGNISIISNDFQKKSVHPSSAMGHRKRHKFKGRLGKN